MKPVVVDQKVVNLQKYNGEYLNFFFTPGSIGSLQSHIRDNWIVKFIKDDPERQEAVVLFERVQYEVTLPTPEVHLTIESLRQAKKLLDNPSPDRSHLCVACGGRGFYYSHDPAPPSRLQVGEKMKCPQCDGEGIQR